jgi:hypothetical protein
MPLLYTAYYSTDGSTWTAITNVQNITINTGRQRMLDQYNASSAGITLRYPTGYASPITALVPGTYIKIDTPTTDPTYAAYYGQIKDVSASYGIPYAGGVGNADYLDIMVEGFFATASRMAGQGYAMAANTVDNQLLDMFTETGISVISSFSPSMAATTLNSTWGDWLNSVMVTINGRLVDSVNVDSIEIKGPYNSSTCTVAFSDTANNATNQVYDQANFSAYSDNFYTQVSVDPESFSPQTVTKAGATVPYRTYTVNTLSASTGQATDQANFLLSQYDTQEFALTSVSCLAEAQQSFKLDRMGVALFAYLVGSRVSVVFRGTTYYSIIEGVTVTATPESSRYTYYLSGQDLNNYLILNNTVFGKLDNNKLGY